MNANELQEDILAKSKEQTWYSCYVNGELKSVKCFKRNHKPTPEDFGEKNGGIKIEQCGVCYLTQCIDSKGHTVSIPFISVSLFDVFDYLKIDILLKPM